MTVFGSKLAIARTINRNNNKKVIVVSPLSVVLALREEAREVLLMELRHQLKKVSFGTIPEQTVKHYFNGFLANTRIMTKEQAVTAAVKEYCRTIDSSMVR